VPRRRWFNGLGVQVRKRSRPALGQTHSSGALMLGSEAIAVPQVLLRRDLPRPPRFSFPPMGLEHSIDVLH